MEIFSHPATFKAFTAPDASWKGTCLVGLGLLVLIYAVTAIWAWYPLRKVPAPSLWAHFSYLWLGKTTLSGRQHWVYRDFRQKYGPLVRIGPRIIHTDDPEIIRKINAPRGLYHRSDWYMGARFNPHHDNLLSMLNPEHHSQFKKRVAPAYNRREAPDFEPAIDSQINAMLELVRRKCATASKQGNQAIIDLSALMSYLSMDIITRLGFGQEIGYLKDDTDHFNFLQSLHAAWPFLTFSTDVPWIRNVLFSRIGLLLMGPRSTDNRGLGALMATGKYCVRKRFEEGKKGNEGKQDMLASFMRRGLSQQECELETLLMLVAGSETTSSVIRSTLLHLISTPRVYSRLKAEIRTAVKEGRVSSPIKQDEARGIPYLRAVIYEGLRMRPPLLGLFSKAVAEAGDVLHGIHIPAGTAISTNISALVLSPVLFGDDADIFRPERFLEVEPKKQQEMERSVDFVFGSGQYMCVGKTIALIELNKAIFETMRAFELQLVNPMSPVKSKTYGVFLDDDMLVSFKEEVPTEP